MRDQIARTVHVDADMRIKPPDRALDRLDRGPDIGAAVRRSAPPDRAGARQMMVHLTPHRPRFAHHGFGEFARLRARGIHDDGQRRFERMRQIARMAPRFLRLAVVVLDERVQLLDQRRDLVGHVALDSCGIARAQLGDRIAQLAKRQQPVPGLERRHQQQPEPEQQEAVDQRRA